MEADLVVLRELCGSVYLTTDQKAALRRLLAQTAGSGKRNHPIASEGSGGPGEAGSSESRSEPTPKNQDLEPSSELEEDRRHALLGPCGAE